MKLGEKWQTTIHAAKGEKEAHINEIDAFVKEEESKLKVLPKIRDEMYLLDGAVGTE